MPIEINSNVRIAKNTIFLYIRTIVVLLVSLYTSRVVLQILGAEDLGIYNVVGGIVAMMSFFQVAQTKSTSRFITYELGKNSDGNTLQKVFSICMTIHVAIAIIGILFGETIGLWMVTHWIDIPAERQVAAMYVYQFSIVVFCAHIVRVPYDAIIIAHEKMSMFAYMSILEAVLQLGFVFLLMTLSGDSLIYYSMSIALIALILYISYYIYVRKHYETYRFKFFWEKDYGMKILSFSGWTLLGSGANTATQQGVSMLMNNFIGLIANAAMGFASQVNIAVGKFVNGFSTAFTPQIIKLYAQKDYESLNLLVKRSSKFSFALCYLMALPLIVNMGFILSIWLGDNVPMYTKEFCQLILTCTIIDATTGVYNTTITATGKIKYYQIAISISFLLDLVCCSVLLICKINPVLVFASRILTRGIINMFIGLYFIKDYISFDVKGYFAHEISKIIITIIITVIPVAIISYYTDGWCQLILTGIVSVVLVCGSVILIIMNNSERNVIICKIKALIWRR